jgi:hypothetical protein
VKSLDRKYSKGDFILVPMVDPKKRKKVNLCKKGKMVQIHIYVLVAMAFLGHVRSGRSSKIVVDHINNDPSDDRLVNLQVITQRENSTKDQNKKFTGAFYQNQCNKWMSQICIDGKKVHLGLFSTPEEAHKAYKDKLKNLNQNID